jgi:hypothetical protein
MKAAYPEKIPLPPLPKGMGSDGPPSPDSHNR